MLLETFVAPVGVINKSKGARSVAQIMRQLARNARLVFDYLRIDEKLVCLPRLELEQIYRGYRRF